MYINKLDDIINTSIRTEQLSLFIQSLVHILFLVKKIMIKDPKFKVGDHVRIWKYKNIFARGFIRNWSGEMF